MGTQEETSPVNGSTVWPVYSVWCYGCQYRVTNRKRPCSSLEETAHAVTGALLDSPAHPVITFRWTITRFLSTPFAPICFSLL